MGKKGIIGLIFGLWALSFQAQVPVFKPRTLPKNLSEKLNCIFQDKEGWIWIGTEKGVLKYDGKDSEYISSNDSLLRNSATAVYDYDGKLWIGYENGAIGQLDYTHGNVSTAIELWRPEEGLPQKAITGFVADAQNRLWFSTYGEGLYCFDGRKIANFDVFADKIAGNDVYCLALGKNSDVLIGTDAGISACSLSPSGTKKVKNYKVADGLPDEIIQVICPDDSGKFWLGSHDKGICLFDPMAETFSTLELPDDPGPVTAIQHFGGRELWVGTEKRGLCLIDLHAHQCKLAGELADKRIQALLKDREGLIWAIANQKQLFSCPRKFSLLPLNCGDVQCILFPSKTDLWVGSPTGLYKINQQNSESLALLKENVLSVFQDKKGDIWAGTFGNGLYLLDATGKVKHHFTEKNGLPNGSIFSIAACDNQVWVATLGGLTEIRIGDDGQFTVVPIEDPAIKGVYIYKIHSDNKGRLWLGTDGKGLVKYEHGHFDFVTPPNREDLKTVFSIATKEGEVWFSTDGYGLTHYDGRDFKRYSDKNFLHSKDIQSLAFDQNNQLLICYAEGVDILNTETDHAQFWSPESGIPALVPVLNAIYSGPDGQLWVGGEKGILRVAADSERFAIDPKTILTAVRVFMQPIDFAQQVQFPHSQNYFIFEFVGLWFCQPDAVTYQFKLEGFDPDWKNTRDRNAVYPNLPPGKYVFRVKSTEHGGFSGTSEVMYRFEIEPPFWTTWWFALAIGLSGLFLGYLVIHDRDKKLQREANLQRERIEAQFASLKSQINPHFLFNSFNTLITIIEENPQNAVEYVEHLSDFYRSIIAHRERDFITIQEEMELVNDFGFLLKKRFEDNFSLSIQPYLKPGEIMPLTLQLLVENAVKHNIISKNKPLRIEIFSENDDYIVVRNNLQKKMQSETGTHFGLQSLRKRYEILGGLPIVVDQTPDYFSVKVPIVKK